MLMPRVLARVSGQDTGGRYDARVAPSKSAKKRKQAQRRQQAQAQQVHAVADARKADALKRPATDEIVPTGVPSVIADDDLDDDGGVVLGVTSARAGAINWVIVAVVVLALVAMAYWLLTRTPT
jgi:hypothetical protein